MTCCSACLTDGAVSCGVFSSVASLAFLRPGL